MEDSVSLEEQRRLMQETGSQRSLKDVVDDMEPWGDAADDDLEETLSVIENELPESGEGEGGYLSLPADQEAEGSDTPVAEETEGVSEGTAQDSEEPQHASHKFKLGRKGRPSQDDPCVECEVLYKDHLPGPPKKRRAPRNPVKRKFMKLAEDTYKKLDDSLTIEEMEERWEKVQAIFTEPPAAKA